MSDLVVIILYTAGAGLAIPAAGLLASVEKIRPEWLENELRHGIIAFGGGILLAAVALVLVPEGSVYVDHALLSVGLLLGGGLLFFGLEYALGVRRREKPQLTAMLLDYLPESLALGGAFALSSESAPLLAVIIGLQNLPEGFNAYRELRAKPDSSGRRILGIMFLMAPLGSVVALIGWAYFSRNEALLGATMLISSGGILYLIFQDIAPQARMQRHWAPPLGAVLGFSAGMLGDNLIV